MEFRIRFGRIAAALIAAGVMVGVTGCRSDEGEPPKTTTAPQPAQTTVPTGYRPSAGANMNVVELAFPTGDRNSSALLVHQVTPKAVRAGQNYSYEIHVTNLTGSTLQNVLVSQENMQNMAMSSSTPTAAAGAGGAAQWSLGDLGARETEIIKVTARAERIGTASNCITASYNNSLCATTQVVEPALVLTKACTESATPCDTITLRYEVRNPGSGPAENVRVRDTLPAGLTTSDGRSAIDQPVGTLAPGEAKSFSITAKASRTGRFESTATASADGGLTATSAACATTVRQAVLAIDKAGPERLFLGRPFTFEITVSNTGDAPATNVVLEDPVPAGTTFAAASDGGRVEGGKVMWSLGTIAPGASRKVTLQLNSSVIAEVRNQATARADCAAAVSDTAVTSIQGIPAILLEVIDIDDPIEVGGVQTYVITVTNQGSAPGTNIRIVCTLPGEQEFVAATGATAGSASGQTVTFAPLASLAAKAKAEFRVQVRARGEGDVRFKVGMSSDQFRAPVEETESTNQYR